VNRAAAAPAGGRQAEPGQGGSSGDTSPVERYGRRRDRALAERDHLAGRAGRVSNLRLITFVAGLGALVWAELRPETGPVALTLFALALVAFFALIVVHSRLKERERRAAELAAVNDEALARIPRNWDRLPQARAAGPAGHAYAHDLDIFGPASVARLLATTGTGVGRARLHDWLLAPAPVDRARRRQEAVRELVPMLDFRQELQVAGRLAGNPDRRALDEFLAWAEGEPWLLKRPLVVWVSRLIPGATLVLLGLQLEGALDRPWWMVSLLAGVGLIVALRRQVHRRLEQASLGDASLRDYATLVQRIQDQSFTAEPLVEIRHALTEENDARQELDRLGWMTELAELRHAGLFYLLLHVPTLWDFHVLWGLERWQVRAGRHVRAWIEHVARLDAAAALAGLPLDEPGWTFPDLAPDGDRLEAEGLAHPLLPADQRVPNDVSLGPPGTFVMVTGSNMSGKSTLLRAVGVNAVLALAGGPVCATRLRVPPLDLRTSMRVQDSLERGVSLFMAELQQLKRVVDAADAATDRLLLYLLDEILHGTNTAERQVAVREVLSHLLRRPALGAISTHDLELATAEPLASAVVPVHFRETIHPEGHEPPMTFDYQLRDGIATSTNALKLVRLVGLAGREA
jgi:ABC-type multidrug transport system fused ATPase/permease subunit